MRLTKLRAAPERQDKVPPCAPVGTTAGGTGSQLIRGVRRTTGEGEDGMPKPRTTVRTLASFTLVGGTLATLAVAAEGGEAERRVLAGLQPFTVEADELPRSLSASDLNVEQLRSFGEARLRAAGLPLADRGVQPKAPYLLIVMEGECKPTGAWSSLMQLYVGWLLDTPRLPDGVRLVRVWIDQTQVYGVIASYQCAAERQLSDLLDKFVSEYRTAKAGG
jgi:hypothetical protein